MQQQDFFAPAPDHHFGQFAAGDELLRLFADIAQGQRSDARAAQYLTQYLAQKFGVILAAEHGDQPRGEQGFRDRPAWQLAADLCHQHGGIESAEAKAVGLFRYAQHEGPEFGQFLPYLGVETGLFGFAQAFWSAFGIEQARVALAHHLLIFGEVEIHGVSRQPALRPPIILEMSICPVASAPMKPPSTGNTTPLTMLASAELSSTSPPACSSGVE